MVGGARIFQFPITTMMVKKPQNKIKNQTEINFELEGFRKNKIQQNSSWK